MKNNFHQTEINGAMVSGYSMPGTRSVMFYVVIKAGAWYETEGQRGFFHLLEHSLFSGTAKYPTKDSFEDYRESHGVVNNAWTSNSSLGIWFKAPDIYWKEALKLLGSMLFEPIVSKETIEREIKIIKQEFKDKWNSPVNRFSREYTKVLLGKDHIYNRQPLSSVDELSNANSDNLLSLHKEYFVPANMVISIAGNISWEEIKTELESILGKVNKGETKEYKKEVINSKPAKLVYEDETKQAIVVMDWLAKGTEELSKKDRLTLNMVRQLLGNNRRSILNNRLREEMGIAYQCGCTIWDWITDMALELWVQTDKSNVEAALENIRWCAKEFSQKKYSKEQFKQTREFMDMQTLMHYDSVANVAEDISMQMFFNKDHKVYSPEETIEVASQIKAEDVGKIFNRLVNLENEYVGILLDKSGSQ